MFKTPLNRRQVMLGPPALLFAGSATAQVTSTGIIFAGASWCPVCKKAAPILATLSERLGLPVIVASGDERPIAPFTRVVPLSGHPIASAVTAYPTTLIYNAKRDAVIGSIEGYRNPTWYLAALRSFIRQSEEVFE
jgi:thiol-disulfide isomerase/thioredoxin